MTKQFERTNYHGAWVNHVQPSARGTGESLDSGSRRVERHGKQRYAAVSFIAAAAGRLDVAIAGQLSVNRNMSRQGNPWDIAGMT